MVIRISHALPHHALVSKKKSIRRSLKSPEYNLQHSPFRISCIRTSYSYCDTLKDDSETSSLRFFWCSWRSGKSNERSEAVVPDDHPWINPTKETPSVSVDEPKPSAAPFYPVDFNSKALSIRGWYLDTTVGEIMA